MKIIEKTNGKKTPFAAACYIIFQIIISKYPNIINDHTENLIELLFASGFFVTLGHKLRVYIPSIKKWLKSLKNKNYGKRKIRN